MATAGLREGGEPLRFTFISSNRSWGGSEELWAATAAALAGDGHRVEAYKSGLPPGNPRIRALKTLSCRLTDLAVFGAATVRPLSAAARSSRLAMAWEVAKLWLYLRLRRTPHLAILSQGGNHDGWPMASVCRRLRIPYVCLCHKASDLYWPPDRWRGPIRDAFAAARWAFFVSRHTLRLTEEQIGAAIPNSSLVRNPFNVPWSGEHSWPSPENGLRLGCVGRLSVNEKGQDILLRVLASEKWRSRPLSVSFLGDGEQRRGLEAMAASLGLESVRFLGVSDDIEGFWRDHHALVLPSRAEGLPLVIVEALLMGRVAIVTDAGGNAELLEEGVTGFVADGANEKSLDAAMERAWARRDEWRELGAAAAVRTRRTIPADPARDFAERLVLIASASNQQAH